MSSEEFPNRRRAIQTQRGRKRQKIDGTLQRLWTSPRLGPPPSGCKACRGQATQG